MEKKNITSTKSLIPFSRFHLDSFAGTVVPQIVLYCVSIRDANVLMQWSVKIHSSAHVCHIQSGAKYLRIDKCIYIIRFNETVRSSCAPYVHWSTKPAAIVAVLKRAHFEFPHSYWTFGFIYRFPFEFIQFSFLLQFITLLIHLILSFSQNRIFGRNHALKTACTRLNSWHVR